MPFWIEDILHEIGTVVPWFILWFGLNVFFGYLLRDRVTLLMFRLLNLLIMVVGSYFALDFAMEDSLEIGFITWLFTFTFTCGLLTGFEGRWLYKELFSIGFWFRPQGDSSQARKKRDKKPAA